MIRTQPTAATIRDIMNEGPHGRRGWLHDILITAFDEAVGEFEAGNYDNIRKRDHGINGVARQKDVQKLQKEVDGLEERMSHLLGYLLNNKVIKADALDGARKERQV